MSEPRCPDPRSGIRAVFLVGVVASVSAGVLYLLARGHLLESFADPVAVTGAALGVGLVGAGVGGVAGLSVRVLQGGSGSWRAPVVAAGGVAAGWGVAVSRFVVATLWSD